MSNEPTLTEIQRLIMRFMQLDGDAVEYVQSKDWQALAKLVPEAVQINYKLRSLLAFHGHVASEEEAIDLFRRQAFSIQAVIKQLQAEDDHEWDPPYMFDAHLDRLIDFEDPDWPAPINERLLKVQVLLTRKPLPSWVLRHLLTLRRCYALEMHEAAWIFMRSLIEALSFEWLKQRGEFGGSSKVRYIAERKLEEILRMIEDLATVPASDLAKIRKIKRRANKIIHSKRVLDDPTEAETFEAISQTVRYAELLFRINGV